MCDQSKYSICYGLNNPVPYIQMAYLNTRVQIQTSRQEFSGNQKHVVSADRPVNSGFKQQIDDLLLPNQSHLDLQFVPVETVVVIANGVENDGVERQAPPLTFGLPWQRCLPVQLGRPPR